MYIYIYIYIYIIHTYFKDKIIFNILKNSQICANKISKKSKIQEGNGS